jgi:hypothetical protein
MSLDTDAERNPCRLAARLSRRYAAQTEDFLMGPADPAQLHYGQGASCPARTAPGCETSSMSRDGSTRNHPSL